jgi:Domain of unknown function (DUF4350)
VTVAPTAPTGTGRRRTWRWVALALIVITAVATVTAWLTAPRAGGRMDPTATSADGAHALVSLLRDQGVDVVVADTAEDARRAARADTLLLIAQTAYLIDDDQLSSLAAAPGDRLLIEPTSNTREALAPQVRSATSAGFGGEPDCDLREAQRAGTVNLGAGESFRATWVDRPVTRCYGGALVRYRSVAGTVTVVGASGFMTNSGLLHEGNAALAMNLAGGRPRLVWYAPQRFEVEHVGAATIFDLIPDRVTWIFWQLWLVVGLVALWKARRLGPLVAEQLPVVVRASETVEGRGRLYRSRRARDRAAAALRTATLQRLGPRLGLSSQTTPSALAGAVAARAGGDPAAVHHTLYGPAPTTDADLVALANALDDIERQVADT